MLVIGGQDDECFFSIRHLYRFGHGIRERLSVGHGAVEVSGVIGMVDAPGLNLEVETLIAI